MTILKNTTSYNQYLNLNELGILVRILIGCGVCRLQFTFPIISLEKLEIVNCNT